MNSMEIIWIAVLIVAVVIELLTPSALVSIWLAVGALASWISALLGCPIIVQILICLAVSFLFILIVRPIAITYLRGNVTATNADRLIGDVAVVTRAIGESDWGEVKIHGTIWSAVSVDHMAIAVDEKVRVIAIEGAKLIVRKSSN